MGCTWIIYTLLISKFFKNIDKVVYTPIINIFMLELKAGVFKLNESFKLCIGENWYMVRKYFGFYINIKFLNPPVWYGWPNIYKSHEIKWMKTLTTLFTFCLQKKINTSGGTVKTVAKTRSVNYEKAIIFLLQKQALLKI